MKNSYNYMYKDEFTQESVGKLINFVNSFISSITPSEQKVMLERHETEEEARKYFGEKFIQKFDSLITNLHQQQTIVALQGTYIGFCSSICENGLKYSRPTLLETAITQSMPYGQKEFHYGNYESLLNWKHK